MSDVFLNSTMYNHYYYLSTIFPIVSMGHNDMMNGRHPSLSIYGTIRRDLQFVLRTAYCRQQRSLRFIPSYEIFPPCKSLHGGRNTKYITYCYELRLTNTWMRHHSTRDPNYPFIPQQSVPLFVIC